MMSNADAAAGESGLRNVDECGLFRCHDGAPGAVASVEDVRTALPMSWISPQRRADPAEIDVAVAAAITTEV
jgi:hypothetical protein